MRLNETNLNLGLTIFFFLFLEPGYTEPISFAYNSTTFKCFCWNSTRHDSLSTSHKKKYTSHEKQLVRHCLMRKSSLLPWMFRIKRKFIGVAVDASNENEIL